MSGHDEELEGQESGFAARSAADEPALDASTQLELGRILGQYSQDLINQPIPDILLTLLAKLEAREREAP
ncbi:MAG TPA: NepR family anti-sigma factor [Methylocystis sp.]|nr:NepR family anti-sigma factor [Methylocystis sp.]